MPAARSSAASPAVATASHAAPPRCAARAAVDRPVPVAVGLDHRAQRRAERGQPGAVALDRARVDPRLRPQRHSLRGQRVEDVDAGDDPDQPPVLDHRQPVVLVRAIIRAASSTVASGSIVIGSSVITSLAIGADRLAQPLLELLRRLQEHDPAEQLDVVREVQVLRPRRP